MRGDIFIFLLQLLICVVTKKVDEDKEILNSENII